MNGINNVKCKRNDNFRFQVILESVFIFIVYIACVIGFHHLYIIKVSQYGVYDNAIQIVSDYKTAIDEDLMKDVESNSSVEAVIPVSIEKTLLNRKIQKVPVCIVGVDSKNLDILMDKYNCKLIEGRLPKKDDEVLLNKNVAYGKNVKLNQYIKDGRKVVGIIESSYLINFRYIDKEISSKLNDYCVLVLIKDQVTFPEEIIQKIKDDGYNVINKSDKERDTRPITHSLLLIMLFVLILFIGTKIICSRLGRGIKERGIKEFKQHILACILGIVIGILVGNGYNVFIEAKGGIKAELININFVTISICISLISYIINKVFFVKSKKRSIKDERI